MHVGVTEDFWALPVRLKGTFFTKRKFKYKIIDNKVKEEYVKLIKDGSVSVEEAAKKLGCNKRNIKNWLK